MKAGCGEHGNRCSRTSRSKTRTIARTTTFLEYCSLPPNRERITARGRHALLGPVINCVSASILQMYSYLRVRLSVPDEVENDARRLLRPAALASGRHKGVLVLVTRHLPRGGMNGGYQTRENDKTRYMPPSILSHIFRRYGLTSDWTMMMPKRTDIKNHATVQRGEHGNPSGVYRIYTQDNTPPRRVFQADFSTTAKV